MVASKSSSYIGVFRVPPFGIGVSIDVSPKLVPFIAPCFIIVFTSRKICLCALPVSPSISLVVNISAINA